MELHNLDGSVRARLAEVTASLDAVLAAVRNSTLPPSDRQGLADAVGTVRDEVADLARTAEQVATRRSAVARSGHNRRATDRALPTVGW
jgi:hypothetical protein